MRPFQTWQMSLALGNTTWDLFSQKGHHHRAGIKSPGMLFFEMAKWQEGSHGEFRPRCKLSMPNSSGCFAPSPLKGCAAEVSVGQGRCTRGAGAGGYQQNLDALSISHLKVNTENWDLFLSCSTASASASILQHFSSLKTNSFPWLRPLLPVHLQKCFSPPPLSHFTPD